MQNQQEIINIPIFYNCTICKRSIVENSNLWSDKEKHICVCCECISAGDDKDKIYTCRREKCKMHKYIDRDFITESIDSDAVLIETKQLEENYDEASNKCYCCNKELLAFLHINIKLTNFNNKGEIDSKSSKQLLKLCPACAKRFNDILPIKLINTEK